MMMMLSTRLLSFLKFCSAVSEKNWSRNCLSQLEATLAIFVFPMSPINTNLVDDLETLNVLHFRLLLHFRLRQCTFIISLWHLNFINVKVIKNKGKLEYWQSQEGSLRALCKFAGAMFKLYQSRSKFTVKVTYSNSIVLLERYGHKEHICQIWTPILLQYGQCSEGGQKHGQGHTFQLYVIIGKALSKGTHLPNMKALSLRIKSYGQWQSFLEVGQRSWSRSHVQN